MAQSGQLDGPHLEAGGLTLQAGDRVICLKNRLRLGVLNGDLATIVSIDREQRAVTVRLDRTQEIRTLPHWYLDDGHLDYGYALTGHKAQGTTARRAYTVAGDSVDREWVYVTMSRGQEANTIHLVDPELTRDECTHVAHQHDTGVNTLVSALRQTAAQTAAIDTGRGPRILADDQLAERRKAIAAHLVARKAPDRQDPASVPGEHRDELVEYLKLKRELEARHLDRLAVLSYQPPAWVVDTLGERPAEPRRAAAWDRVVDQSLRYRDLHGVPEEAEGLIGAQPDHRDVQGRAEWKAWHRSLERDLKAINRIKDRGLGDVAIG